MLEQRQDGPRAFFVAVCACLVQFTVFGVMNSFAVFADDMSRDQSLNKPTQTQSSFGNSVGVGLAPVFGLVVGPMTDRFGPRILLICSVVSLFAGLWLSSLFASNVLTLVVLFSVPIGLSAGLMLTPGATAATSYFSQYRTLGTGIAFCGGGLGSCVMPALAGVWAQQGWRHAFRNLSGFTVIGLVAACFVDVFKPQVAVDYSNIEEPLQPTKKSLRATLKDLAPICTSKMYIAHFISFAFFTWAFYGLLYAAVPFASSMGKQGTVYEGVERITTQSASTLMTFFGVAQIIGSLTVGYTAQKLGNKTTHNLYCMLGAFSCLLMVFARTYAQCAALLVAVGLATAGVMPTVPAMIATKFSGENVGVLIGVVFFAAAIGGFSAPPVISALVAANEGDYSLGWILMSAAQTISGLICFVWVSD